MLMKVKQECALQWLLERKGIRVKCTMHYERGDGAIEKLKLLKNTFTRKISRELLLTALMSDSLKTFYFHIGIVSWQETVAEEEEYR